MAINCRKMFDPIFLWSVVSLILTCTVGEAATPKAMTEEASDISEPCDSQLRFLPNIPREIMEPLAFIQLAGNLTGGSGNGAITCIHGHPRFVDTLSDSEISQADSRCVTAKWFSSSCGSRNFRRLNLAADEQREIDRILAQLSKGGQSEFADLLKQKVKDLEQDALFSDYRFDYLDSKWRGSTRLPPDRTVSSDLTTAYTTIFYTGFHKKLPLKDRVASILHTVLRSYAKDRTGYFPVRFDLATVERATRLLVKNPASPELTKIFQIEKAKSLSARTRRLKEISEKISSKIDARGEISSEELSDFYSSLKRFGEDYQADPKEWRMIFKIAADFGMPVPSQPKTQEEMEALGKKIKNINDWVLGPQAADRLAKRLVAEAGLRLSAEQKAMIQREANSAHDVLNVILRQVGEQWMETRAEANPSAPFSNAVLSLQERAASLNTPFAACAAIEAVLTQSPEKSLTVMGGDETVNYILGLPETSGR